MTIIAAAEWKPDMPDLSDCTTIATGVIPRTPESYGPFSMLAEFSSNALDGPCLGAISAQNADLSVWLFAGSADKMYMMNGASNAFNDVSISGDYTVDSGDSWRFSLFGNDVLATDFTDAIQVYTMGVSTLFSVLSADAPQARFICTPKNFCMVGNTYDPVGGVAPGRLWWSASNDPTSWPTPGSALAQQNMSDYQDFPGPQGEITSLVANLAGCDVAVFFRHAVWRGFYTGPPDVFDFYPAENVGGCPAPNSTVPLGGIVYYLGEDGFYSYDGTQSTPIGLDKVDKTFWGNVSQSYLYNIIGAADVINKIIVWIYPSINSTLGVPDTAIMYRWDIGRWSTAPLNAQWLARFISFGQTMEGLTTAGYTDLDMLPFSLDSRVWLGGALQLGALDGSNKLAFFSGTSLEAQVGTKAMQIFPDSRAFVQGARPLVDGGVPTVAMSERQNFYDPEVFGTATAPNAMGDCPQRSDGRYHRALVTVPAGSVWTHVRGVDLTAIRSGWR